VKDRNDVELLLVGDELLKGERRDAHLSRVALALLPLGVQVERAHVCRDDVDAISDVVRARHTRTRVLITTGGLGPTDDDITRNGVADALGLALAQDDGVWDSIVNFFAERGAETTENNRRQAMFPEGATVIDNPNGTAPGFHLVAEGCDVFVLPGPPRELGPMLDTYVAPEVTRIFGREPLRVETFRTIGIGESQLFARFETDIARVRAFNLSYLPSMSGVDVVLTQKPGAEAGALDADADAFEQVLRDGLGHKLYERGQRTLANVVHDLMVERDETLAVAESLTGGRIGDMLVGHPGSSAYLLADVVAYADAAKCAFIGVHEETLAGFGAVSEETCTEMAHGVRGATGATWAIATTGIAGPAGGSDEKPVGLTYLGVAWEGGSRIRRLQYRGSREIVRERAAQGALWMLFEQIRNR
jgi:nicotinamide-nucleotide amidase